MCVHVCVCMWVSDIIILEHKTSEMKERVVEETLEDLNYNAKIATFFFPSLTFFSWQPSSLVKILLMLHEIEHHLTACSKVI